MGWTVPRDWVADEVVTAAVMNSAVKDNLRYLKGLDGAITFDAEIITTHNVDGVDVSAHEARHVSGGDDDIDSALAIAAMANLTENRIWRGNASNRPVEHESPYAVEATQAMWRAFGGNGTVSSAYFNDLNDGLVDVDSVLVANAEGIYIDIAFGDLVKIQRWRQYGDSRNEEDGEWKIQYWNIEINAWADWVTGISTRAAHSYSDFVTETIVVTTKIRLVCTTLEAGGNNWIRELEVIY